MRQDKNEFYKKLDNELTNKTNCIEKETYCVSKSKFLLPIKMKIYPAKTQENDFIYIASIIQQVPLMSTILELKEENDTKFCVLTDNNLIIKSFSPNCLEHLNLQYSFVNSDNSIINNIKEFFEDFLLAINNANINNTHCYQDFSLINNVYSNKRHGMNNGLLMSIIQKILIKKNYNKKSKITWVINKHSNTKSTNFEKIVKRNSLRRRGSKISLFIQHNYEKEINLIMEIKKVILDKELSGYYFIFTNDNEEKISDKMNSNISDINNRQIHKFKQDIIDVESNYNSQIGFSNSNILSIKKINSYKFVKEDENNSSINNNNKDNKYEFKKMPSINNYNNIFEKIVNDNFTSNPLYLSFNIKDFSFNLTDNRNHNKNFNDYSKKEASNKMNIYYNEYLKSIQKKSSSTSTELEDESEKYSSSNTELVSSSSSSSTSKNNSITQKSFSKIKTIKSFVPSQAVIKLNNYK